MQLITYPIFPENYTKQEKIRLKDTHPNNKTYIKKKHMNCLQTRTSIRIEDIRDNCFTFDIFGSMFCFKQSYIYYIKVDETWSNQIKCIETFTCKRSSTFLSFLKTRC